MGERGKSVRKHDMTKSQKEPSKYSKRQYAMTVSDKKRINKLSNT